MDNIFLKALDSAVSKLTASPKNMAAPPRARAQNGFELPGDNSAKGSSYRGASQNGTLDGLDQQAPLSARAKAELHPVVLPRPKPDALASVPFPTAEQVRCFDAYLTAKGYKVPEDVLAKLKEDDVAWLRLQEAIAQAARSQNGRYHAHLDDIARRTAEGDLTVQREDAWTRQDWADDGRERIGAFKTKSREIEERDWAIAEPALLDKSEFANSAADELDVEAQAWFAEFATPAHPLSFILQLRKYALTLSDGSRRYAGLPSSMLEVL
jgi:hypothetical protein